MTRVAWLGLLALAACSRPLAPPVPALPVRATTEAAGPAVCRVGPDGARPIADRGIGGTGAPAVQTADRGIGGTGIIGVITGFASVCVAGEEVALPASLPAQIDGKLASLDDLRAGQVVAVAASGPAGSLLAQEIAVRHVVIGPVQAAGGGMLTVAGQQVLVGDATGSAIHAAIGQFVAVSGLRQPGGLIVATRIDPATPGAVLVRGDLVRIYDTARIGSQTIRLPEGPTMPGGFPVVVTGTMQGDVLVADSVARDIADESPAAYFGPAVSNFVVEGYLAAAAGGYFVNRDFVRGGSYRTESRGRGIATFSRQPGGGLVARGDQPGVPNGGGTALDRGFAPAPVPRGGGFNGPSSSSGSIGGPFDQGRQGLSGSRFTSPDFMGQGAATMPGPSSPPQRH